MFPQVRETLDLRFLITADHCLRRIPDDAELVLDFGPEGELRGRIHERLADADLALIWLLSKPQLSRPMLADHAHREDRWRVPPPDRIRPASQRRDQWKLAVQDRRRRRHRGAGAGSAECDLYPDRRAGTRPTPGARNAAR
jgi:hypothetical protein